MSKYVDLVLVKFDDKLGLNLSYAPFMAGIQMGNKVIVDTLQGEKLGVVVAVESVENGGEEMEFIKLTASEKEPDRVIGRVVPFDYSEREGNRFAKKITGEVNRFEYKSDLE